ncbi:hypothetical protein VMCG_06520 [Cytospora schulzeri]|uniref:Uncharacterized protein n=1 Tax=Cytospora schulzeri TaxID=448051 RepID=A0A423WBQ9_9PEZI|nr:hypothetical protein VMCG_06520 [Valsa malicola]
MTRVTAPREISKLTRALSTTAAAPRPSRLPSNLSQTAVSRVRKELEQQDVPASERTITTSHRPVVPTPNPNRVIPLMQGFHTTQHSRTPLHHHHQQQQQQQKHQAAEGASPYFMDNAVLPSLNTPYSPPLSESLFPSFSAAAAEDLIIRVPLLPDNFAPARSPTVGHVPEVPDAPLAAPEIVVMAADPAAVNAVSPLTEVEGMGPDGVELMFAHDRAAAAAAAAAGAGAGRSARREGSGGEGEFAGGMLRGLWSGIVDDVLSGGGAQQGKVKPAM